MTWQIHPVSDKNHQEHDDSIADEDILFDGAKDATGTEEGNAEETNGMFHSEELKENSEFASYGAVTSEVVEETSSDEGWQEANSKGRSGNTSNRKFGRRRPLVAQLRINSSENYIVRESSYRNDITSPPVKGTPKITSTTMSSPHRRSKARNFTIKEDPVNHPTKASVSKATLSSLASKSISYKEVALSPPGTVLKPLLEKAEADSVKAENEKCNIVEKSSQNSTVEAVSEHDKKENTCETDVQREDSSSELEEVSLSSDQAKPTEKNGSKLSAAAEPFNPGNNFHHLNSVAVTSIYDANASQGMLVEPVLPPAAARVPCGPRSPLYYRTNYTFRMKHGYTKHHSPIRERSGFGAPRIMNPHAPEFVPRRANSTVSSIKDVEDSSPRKCISGSEKSELARQILLGLLVKSAQQNIDSADEPKVSEEKCENSPDAIAKDSAIIKILYGNEEKNEMVPKSNGSEEQETKKNNGDGEGFIVVTKRRKSRQKFTNGVTGLYNQQSICASVR